MIVAIQLTNVRYPIVRYPRLWRTGTLTGTGNEEKKRTNSTWAGLELGTEVIEQACAGPVHPIKLLFV